MPFVLFHSFDDFITIKCEKVKEKQILTGSVFDFVKG